MAIFLPFICVWIRRNECETHLKTEGKLTRDSPRGTLARDVAGQLVTRYGRASQKRAWVTKSKLLPHCYSAEM
jgi:hypothetical protein